MTKQPITQSQKRFKDSLASLFRPEEASPCDFVFLKSSSDIGVQRNGGRNGARLGPQSFLSYFKKLNVGKAFENKIFQETEVSSENEEKSDFHQAQKAEALRINHIIQTTRPSFICHLGGGHDHIYPLLSALAPDYDKVIVVNVDAHADTRTDSDFHSGTPFRQFADEYKGEFHLFQIGLLELANSKATLSPLNKGNFKILWRHELNEVEKLSNFFKSIGAHIDSKTVVVFSLDADALNGSDMPGVSAVNGNGLTRAELNNIWKLYRELPYTGKRILGFYELNPVYDTLSMLSMRTLGSFLYECF
jgi:formiminoglutamase